jgi:hypothetical protein
LPYDLRQSGAGARATNRGLQLKISTGFVLRIRSSVVELGADAA